MKQGYATAVAHVVVREQNVDESDWPSVLLVGGAGTIGTVLRAGWLGRVEVFDLPLDDACDLVALTRAAHRCEVLVHLAWDTRAENFRNNGFDPTNLVMTRNALEASVAAGVSRVVLASSVHADRFWPVQATSGLDIAAVPVPDSPYGASKVFVEALGRYFASQRAVEVVAIRFGAVNRVDHEPEHASERAVWLPHADCLTLAYAAATEPVDPRTRFALAVGVGDWHGRTHEFSTQLRWRPETR